MVPNPLMVTQFRDVNDTVVRKRRSLVKPMFFGSNDWDFFEPPAEGVLRKAGIAVLDDIALMYRFRGKLLYVSCSPRGVRARECRKGIFAQTLHCDMFVTAVGWTVKWTASIPVWNQNSPARLLSTLLSISRSKRMVLDGRNRRNRMAAGRAKSFESS